MWRFVYAWLLLTPVGTAQAGDFAFLVGVGDYDMEQLRPLQYSRPDIVEFRETLLHGGLPDDHIVTLHDDLRTLRSRRYLAEGAKIRKELQTLLSTLEEPDTLMVALAGHGVQFRGDPAPYFCPLDADLDDRSTLISLAELMKQLEAARPRLKLMMVDACRNDPQSRLRRSTETGAKLESLSIPQLPEEPQGLVTLFSCATGQEALEHPDIGHGVFFHHVLRAFQGEGDVNGDEELTLDEVVAFAKDRTRTYARATFGAAQTPRQIGSVDGAWVVRDLSIEKDLAEIDRASLNGGSDSFFRERAGDRIRHWQSVAARSSTVGIYLVANCYELGLGGLPQDQVRAARMYLDAATNGDARAQLELGECYAKGRGVEFDDKESMKWYSRSAASGYASGALYVGRCYLTGKGVAQDEQEAMRWFRKAASKHHRNATAELASYFTKNGTRAEKAEVVELLRAGAERGEAAAQWWLGFYYSDVDGVPRNPAEAAKWYRKAAEQGMVGAQLELGLLYLQGTGVAANPEEAVVWLKKAADGGMTKAAFEMGKCYHSGIGVKESKPEALRWFRQAAREGHANSQNMIGRYYFEGWAVDKDPVEALRWFRKAAYQGDQNGLYNVGFFYEQGIVVKPDNEEAIKWFQKAADKGNADASEALKRLQK